VSEKRGGNPSTAFKDAGKERFSDGQSKKNLEKDWGGKKRGGRAQ